MGYLEEVLDEQKKFFRTNKTKDVNFRIEQLKKLKSIIKENEDRILEALKKDLNKSFFEGYESEIGIVYEEINYQIKHLRKWTRRKRVSGSIIYFKSKA